MKHTKSLTGCWTCRSRRVKCDEKRPVCGQCQKRSYACQGYNVRLHWMTPEVGPVSSEARDAPRESLQRRQFPLERPTSVLTSDEIETILKGVESLQDSDLTSNDGVSEALFIHNFGAFRVLSDTDSHHHVQPNPSPAATSTSHRVGGSPIDDLPQIDQVQPDAVSESAATEAGLTLADPWFASLISGDPSPDNAPNQPSPEHPSGGSKLTQRTRGHDRLLLPEPYTPAVMSDGSAYPATTASINEGSPIFSDFSYASANPHLAATRRGDTTTLRPALNPIHLSERDRYLMRYYIEKVVQLSCVFDNAKSPWKTIHLPRALQGIGEIGVGRHTSTIRNALRNDLLSISAFQLSNDHRLHDRHDEAAKWSRAASRYRCEAITLLNHAVTNELDPHTRPKYKDFLATMLSMVSINVMSGDTSTCGVHLDGAAQLISHMKSYKSEYSSKARALHRIYFYVRLIYESTAPTSRTPDLRIRTALHLKSMDISKHSRFIALHDPNERPSDELDMSGYECVYGIPQSLLDMMRRCIELIDQVHDARGRSRSAYIPDDLVEQCDALENELLEWDLENHLPSMNALEINTRIIRHQTQAFHNPLIIYLSQNIRLLNYRYLLRYIEAVIQNVEDIEQIKADTQMLAAPLYWPVFIAASEAFEARLQERFRRWYERVEVYGIEAVRTGVQVIFQVWGDGPTANRTMCAWRSVVEKTGLVLMLT